MEPVVIVSTGIANTASVAAAFRRSGFETELSEDPDRVRSAPYAVLPGVGSFAAGMSRLRERGLDTAIRDRVQDERPLLAICLGLQLLCVSSEESPGVRGIGVIDSQVHRLPAGVRVPQFGWNWVATEAASLITADGYAYYANSYCISERPDGWAAATTNYQAPFIAALERGPIIACQFHPELSGAWGSALLLRWLRSERAGVAC